MYLSGGWFGHPTCPTFREAGTVFLDLVTWRLRISVQPGEDPRVLAATGAEQPDREDQAGRGGRDGRRRETPQQFLGAVLRH